MKYLSAKLFYIWFTITLAIVGFFVLCFDRVNASTLSYDYSRFYVAGVNGFGEDQSWTSAFNLGSYYYYEEEVGPYLSSIRVRFGSSNNFQSGTTYFVKVNTIWGQSGNGSLYEDPKSIICQGSSSSTWSSDENLVSCEYVGKSLYNDNKNASYYFKVTPNQTIYGIQVAWYYKKPPNNVRLYLTSIQNIRVLPSSKITYDNSTSDTINNQTIEINNNNNQNTEKIINNNNQLMGNQCKNILDNNMLISSTTRNGITFTNNGDGTFNVKGTATANTGFLLYDANYLKKYFSGGDYVYLYSSVPHDNNNFNISITYQNNGATSYITPRNSPVLLPSGANISYGLNLWFSSGVSVNYKNVKVLVANSDKAINYCSYGSFVSKLDDTNQSINNLNDTMKDDSVDSPSSDISNFESLLPSNGVITQLIALPLTLYQKIINNINGSCSAFNLGNLYGTDIVFNCIDLSQYLGSTLWTMIDLILSGIFVLTISKKMVKVFNSFTFMKEGDVLSD